MRFYTHGLPDDCTYPCSRSQVKEAFGDDLLESVCFGISPRFEFEERHSPRLKIEGLVLMSLSIRTEYVPATRASLFIYRVQKEGFGPRAAEAVGNLMKSEMRPWLDRMLARSSTEILAPSDELLLEYRAGQLLLHETRYR